MKESSAYLVAKEEFVTDLKDYITSRCTEMAANVGILEPHAEAVSGVFHDTAQAMKDAILLIAEQVRTDKFQILG